MGILTNRDIRFQKDLKLKVKTVMTTANLITAPTGTDLKKAELILQKHKIEKLPVVDKKGKLTGLITYKDIQKFKNFPQACKDEQGRLRVGAAVGVTADTMERVSALVNAGVDVIAIDTAHGHSKGVIETLKMVKKAFPKLQVIAGNIATAAAAKALAKAGLTLNQMDIIELNEAFAAQSIACLRELGLKDNDERVNPNGGAIAIGHPLGATGARLTYSAALELHITQKKYALITMCIGVGQGYAAIIERV